MSSKLHAGKSAAFGTFGRAGPAAVGQSDDAIAFGANQPSDGWSTAAK